MVVADPAVVGHLADGASDGVDLVDVELVVEGMDHAVEHVVRAEGDVTEREDAGHAEAGRGAGAVHGGVSAIAGEGRYLARADGHPRLCDSDRRRVGERRRGATTG